MLLGAYPRLLDNDFKKNNSEQICPHDESVKKSICVAQPLFVPPDPLFNPLPGAHLPYLLFPVLPVVSAEGMVGCLVSAGGSECSREPRLPPLPGSDEAP